MTTLILCDAIVLNSTDPSVNIISISDAYSDNEVFARANTEKRWICKLLGTSYEENEDIRLFSEVYYDIPGIFYLDNSLLGYLSKYFYPKKIINKIKELNINRHNSRIICKGGVSALVL